jgi:predicted transposase YbfD/YdcC
LRRFGASEAIRGINGSGKVEAEVRYFLSSFTGDPLVLAQAIRRHGSIENRLHGVLEVKFQEDDSRVRDPTAVCNFALLRKIAINLVGQDRATKASLRGKRKKAAWDDDYMMQLLKANFMR